MKKVILSVAVAAFAFAVQAGDAKQCSAQKAACSKEAKAACSVQAKASCSSQAKAACSSAAGKCSAKTASKKPLQSPKAGSGG